MGKIAAFAALIIAGAGFYYITYYPSPYRRAAQQLLDSIAQTLETQDRTKFGNQLSAAFTDSAQITLEVVFPAPPGQKVQNADKEVFNKEEFLRFIDNTLFTLKDYHFKAKAESVATATDKKTGTLYFTAQTEAIGMDGALGDANMRYNGDTICNATVNFDKVKQPKFASLSCIVNVRFGLGR